MGIQEHMEGAGPILTRPASTELDCESAALLRATIRPIFTSAVSWAGLADILKDKGYRLAFRQGSLCLTDRTTDQRICGLRFLGFDLSELVRRFGRPIVVARGSQADGDVLSTRPSSAS
ncbi:hypothetical protein [uncultured Ruegeria sp.]|uniref:hypothetical protein n=1 Tax=uncultured Ruegeria sp. TaxID=259304 RepID=UPI002622E3AC|nr:hypothetical protein [uncultured Ruegeria sp.]